MIKKIKFDLLVDGKRIGNFKQLQENFSADLLDYIDDRRLVKWFGMRNMDDKAQQVSEIDLNASPIEQMKALCRILELEEIEDDITYLLEARDARDKKHSEKLKLANMLDKLISDLEIILVHKGEWDGKKNKV